MNIVNFIEKKVTMLMIYFIEKGYGCDCETSDLDDLPDMYKTPKDVFKVSRCASCRAKEVVDWLKEHLKLIKEFDE